MAYDNTNPNGYGLDWDGEISNENNFIILDEGDYDFVVTGFERGQYNGGDNIGPCKKAMVTLEVETPNGNAVVKKDFFLHSKCEGILCAFFTCLGLRQHGEKFRMDWTRVTGARGRAHFAPRTYKGNQYNEVKRWLEPSDSKPATRQTFVPQAPSSPQQSQYQQPQYQQQDMARSYTPGKF